MIAADAPLLILTSSLLTDRMLVYSGLLRNLESHVPVRVWAASAHNERLAATWDAVPATVEPFPEVQPFRGRINLLRRANEFAWDARLAPPSRLSMERHVRRHRRSPRVRAMGVLGRLAARTGTHAALERAVERLMLSQVRSPEAEDRVAALGPRAVLVMNPFWFTEPPVVAAARRLGVPVYAFIPSWDNISTKSRLVYGYDAYFVWSETARRELHHFYPASRAVPVHSVGAPQFDVFRDPAFASEPREAFCARHGLDPTLPIVLYAVGSPNFLQEGHGAVAFAGRVAAGDLGDIQVLVRPHPIHDKADLQRLFDGLDRRVRVQQVAEPHRDLVQRGQDAAEIQDWVSTFRHADVVVNLSSTVTVDAAIFDKPVVNLDFDPEPGQPNQQLVKEINRTWNHFSPVAASGGVWLAGDMDEVVVAVRSYLHDPAQHREGRQRILEIVCGQVAGRSGSRFANALLDVMHAGARRPAMRR